MTALTDFALAGKLAQNAEAKPPATTTGCVMQPKIDGWRLLAEVRENDVRWWTRSGNSFTGKLPEATKALIKHFPAGSWLDGEAHSPGGWGAVQSELTAGHSHTQTVAYTVFDLIAHRNIDARSLTYEKRRGLLVRVFKSVASDWIDLIPDFEPSDETHDKLVADGYEGTVLKRTNAPYASGKRGHGWAKRKADATEDVIIMGFEPGTDVGAVRFGQWKDGVLVERGTFKRKPNIIGLGDEWIGRIVEIRHNGIMPSGAFRHPRLLRVRDDKPSLECVWT